MSQLSSRSTWWCGGRTAEWECSLHDAPLTLEGGDRLDVGDVAVVRLYPTHPEYWADVRPGQAIEMREGSRVVGEATIIEWAGPGDGSSNGTAAK